MLRPAVTTESSIGFLPGDFGRAKVEVTEAPAVAYFQVRPHEAAAIARLFAGEPTVVVDGLVVAVPYEPSTTINAVRALLMMPERAPFSLLPTEALRAAAWRAASGALTQLRPAWSLTVHPDRLELLVDGVAVFAATNPRADWRVRRFGRRCDVVGR